MSDDANVKQGEDNKKQVVFDYSDARYLPVNIFRVANTPDEIIVDLGIQTPRQTDTDVDVQDTLVMSPACAKRLHSILGLVLQQYEQLYGPIETDAKKRITARQAAIEALAQMQTEKPASGDG